MKKYYAESELIINPDGSIFHLHIKPEQLANKKDWRKWKDAKNCVEQPGSDLHRDGNGLRNHDGAGDISLD